MRSIFLVASLILGNFNVDNIYCLVEKIEYFIGNQEKENIKLNIKINTNKRDVVQIFIYFYDENKRLLSNQYFSSSLVIEGSKETQAIIPWNVKNKMYLNMIFYSGNIEKEIENIMLPVYPREYLSCDFNLSKICESNNPVRVVYESKNVRETKEKISLLNNGVEFTAFNNLVPLNKIKIITNINIAYDHAWLKLKDKVYSFDIYHDDGYNFPLDINYMYGIIGLNIHDNYYLNFIEGTMSENYMTNSIYTNEILLPYDNKSYKFIVNLDDAFINFSNVKLNFNVSTKGNFVGRCNHSKYCFRRNYL